MKRIFFSFLALIHLINFAQVEFVGRFNTSMNSSFSDNGRIYHTNHHAFFLNSSWDNKIRLINPSTKTFDILSNVPDLGHSVRTFGTQNAIYFTRTNLEGNKLLLIKIGEELNAETVFELDYPAAEHTSNLLVFALEMNGRFFFHMKGPENNAIYELNTNTDEVTPVVSHDLTADLAFFDVVDEFLFYSVFDNNQRTMYFFDGEASHEISSGPSTSSTWNLPFHVVGKDLESIYLCSGFNGNSFSYYKLNKVSKTLEFLFEFHSVIHEMLAINGSYFAKFNPYHFYQKAEILNDSLFFTNPLTLKNEYLVPSDSMHFISQVRLDLAFPHLNIFTANTELRGLEFFYVDNQDSLELLVDLNLGTHSSVPHLWCGGPWDPDIPEAFRYNDRQYAVLTNGNDPFLYLYEVSENGFLSKLRLTDIKRNFKFFPTPVYLYYTTFDQIHPEVRIHRVKWSDMNDAQPLENSFASDSWSTQITYMRKFQFCDFSGINMRVLGLDLNEHSDILLSTKDGSGDWYMEKRESRNKWMKQEDINHSILKYDEHGKLLWENSIGGYFSYFQDSELAFFDSEGHVQVFGSIDKKGYFDGDSLETIGPSRYHAKLNGETGAVMSKKILFETNYVNDTQFYGYALGEDNTIYLVGRYWLFSQNFGDTTLTSPFEYQNFLAKYDEAGNLIWARNINNSNDNAIYDIRNIAYDSENEEIGIFCSQNESSWNCEEKLWIAELITYDSSGTEKRRKRISGDLSHAGGTLIELGDKSFLAGGFQQKIETDIYKQFSGFSEQECSNLSAYLLQLDENQNKFVRGQFTLDGPVTFDYSVKDEHYVYLVGRSRLNSGKLTIVRFNHQGDYQGEKELNQKPGTYRIALKEGYFVLSMSKAFPEDFLNFHFSQYGYNPEDNHAVTLMRFKIDQWDYPSNYNPMSVQHIVQDLDIWAFPNPAHESIQFNFQDDENKFKNYEIYDVSGRLVLNGVIPNQNFMILNIQSLFPGVYTVLFLGDDTKAFIRIMKEN